MKFTTHQLINANARLAIASFKESVMFVKSTTCMRLQFKTASQFAESMRFTRSKRRSAFARRDST